MMPLIEANKYIQRFYASYPTLTAQRRYLGFNGQLSDPDAPSRFIANVRYDAALAFLSDIHLEIEAARPQWEKDMRARELAGEDVTARSPGERPELTPEYLKAIGCEDLATW